MRSYTMNAIFKRDNWQCQHCKCFANDYRSLHIPSGHKLYLMKDSVKKFLTVDHIIPLSNGGTSDRSNLQTLCNNCNRDKDSKHENAFLLRRKDFITYKDSPNGEFFHKDEYQCCVCRIKANEIGYQAYANRKVRREKDSPILWQRFIINKDFDHYLTVFYNRTWCNKCCSRFGSGVIPTWIMLKNSGFYE